MPKITTIASGKRPDPADDQPYGLLSAEEAHALILALARARVERGFREKTVIKILDWADRVRAEAAMLDLVLDGRANLDWKNGAPILVHRPRPDAAP